MKKLYKITLFIFIWSLFGCNADRCSPDQGESATGMDNVGMDGSRVGKQLNVTILIDLSDRIDTIKHPANPQHYLRDIELAKHMASIFIKDMENRGSFMAKGKFRIIFTPEPDDPNINLIAENLSYDLSIMTNDQKKMVHDSLIAKVEKNLLTIYNSTIEQSKWDGSDLWRFFKNNVSNYCVEPDTNYRSILVVLTDGYMYHKDTQMDSSNKYSYLTESLLQRNGLRNDDWRTVIDSRGFGLLPATTGLDNLEVLFMEISPSKNNKNDEDVLKLILTNWLDEMGVKRKDVHISDLPLRTTGIIDNFLYP